MIDITDKKTFIYLSIFCWIAGGALGIACAFLFYITSHIKLPNGHYLLVEIPPFYGVIFILIMAATALCIALSLKFIPTWVIKYMQEKELPLFIIRFFDFLKECKELNEQRNKEREQRK